MQTIAKFVGINKDFRTWLAAGMPANVVCMEAYRKKKKTVSGKTANRKKTTKITTSSESIPDGVA